MSYAARTTRRLATPLLLIAALAASVLAACGDEPESIIYGGGLSVDPTSVRVAVGAPVPLSATLGNWPSSNPSVRWVSSNPTVFQLDTLTVVPPHRVTGRALRVGFAAVTVSTDGGRESMTIPVAVTAAAP